MGDVVWMVSGWDHLQHAFRVVGVAASEAICTHTALSSNLAIPNGHETCPACALIIERMTSPEAGEAMATDWRPL